MSLILSLFAIGRPSILSFDLPEGQRSRLEHLGEAPTKAKLSMESNLFVNVAPIPVSLAKPLPIEAQNSNRRQSSRLFVACGSTTANISIEGRRQGEGEEGEREEGEGEEGEREEEGS